jgi:hypothetical protein
MQAVRKRKSKSASVITKRYRRIDFTSPENRLAAVLSKYGFHAKTISKATGLSTSQIYYRNKACGIHIKDYRDGKGHAAGIILKKFTMKTISKIRTK